MICFHKEIEKHDLGKGVVMQVLGIGKNMNVIHWDMDDKSEVKTHTHPQEQFGFIIKGQLDLTIEGKATSLTAGDGYFIPEGAEHSFIAIGQTEAIDVFSPIKMNYDNPRIDEILMDVRNNR
ncbi:MAG: cupin domain-containing protein [Spirochaetia bacterium]